MYKKFINIPYGIYQQLNAVKMKALFLLATCVICIVIATRLLNVLPIKLNALEISFATREIRTLCENEDAAFERYGSIIAMRLKTRIAELIASPSMQDFPYALPTIIDNTNHTCSIPIAEFATLIFSINVNVDSIGDVIWSRVLRIQIREIIKDANDSAD